MKILLGIHLLQFLNGNQIVGNDSITKSDVNLPTVGLKSVDITIIQLIFYCVLWTLSSPSVSCNHQSRNITYTSEKGEASKIWQRAKPFYGKSSKGVDMNHLFFHFFATSVKTFPSFFFSGHKFSSRLKSN